MTLDGMKPPVHNIKGLMWNSRPGCPPVLTHITAASEF